MAGAFGIPAVVLAVMLIGPRGAHAQQVSAHPATRPTVAVGAALTTFGWTAKGSLDLALSGRTLRPRLDVMFGVGEGDKPVVMTFGFMGVPSPSDGVHSFPFYGIDFGLVYSSPIRFVSTASLGIEVRAAPFRMRVEGEGFIIPMGDGIDTAYAIAILLPLGR